MFSSTALPSFVISALLLGASASPVARSPPKLNLAFATRFNTTGIPNIVAADQARAKTLKSGSFAALTKRSFSFSVTNAAVTYTANVGIGSPATDYTLLIDTGSSNTWVGAGKAYVSTSTSQDTGKTVSVSYGSGSFSGEEFVDTVTLSPDLVIPNQSIGVASTATGFSGVDGILGIGPTDLTDNTVSDVNQVPTVADNLFSQGTISTESIGVFYEPASVSSSGELTFGGIDTSKTTSSVNFVPITSTSPASQFWGIDQSVTYGGQTILSSTAGIVDTGTTLVLLATDAFNSYQQSTGATLDPTTGLLTISASQFAALQDLNFNIGGNTYPLSANAQIWPRSLNSAIGGNSNQIYLIVADLGSNSGQGLDFIDGYTFLERFYSVFDTTNNQVGFATTEFTTSTAN
jgi:hypothetical protein